MRDFIADSEAAVISGGIKLHVCSETVRDLRSMCRFGGRPVDAIGEMMLVVVEVRALSGVFAVIFVSSPWLLVLLEIQWGFI